MKTDDSVSAVALSSLAVVDVRGDDAAAFLQAQLSNDVAGAGASRACLAGYCSPKGRLLALPLVLTLPAGGLRLLVERDLRDGLLQRLRMFVLRADVTFEPRESLRCVGLIAPGADADGDGDGLLAHGVRSLPERPPAEVLDVLGGSDGADETQILRWHDASAPAPCRRYIVVAPADDAPDTDTDTDAGAGAGAGAGRGAGASSPGSDGEALWRLGDISAGVPRIVPATREAFVPQMVNLQHVGGLSFRKGCYPGQEIVARMQYLGKLKRHMRRFRVRAPGGADPGSVAAGDELSDGDGGEAGRVVDAATGPDGTEILAVVRIDAEPAALGLHGAPLETLPLPYSLDDVGDGAREPGRTGAAGNGARAD